MCDQEKNHWFAAVSSYIILEKILVFSLKTRKMVDKKVLSVLSLHM